MSRADIALREFQYSLKRYHKSLLDKSSAGRRSGKPVDWVRQDFTRKVIGKTEKPFVRIILSNPRVLIQRIDKFYEQWNQEFEDLETRLEDSLERVIQGTQEDIYADLESEYEDEEGDIDLERMQDEKGISDPYDIDPEDIFNGEYGNRYDMNYVIDYMSQEFGHNVDGRYPFWDKYVRPFFKDSDMDQGYFSAPDDVISKPLNIIHGIQDEFDDVYKWLRDKLSMMVHDVKFNQRLYIASLFSGEQYSWEASDGVITS